MLQTHSTPNMQLLYQSDPSKLEFEAEIQQTLKLPDGRIGVILDQTYFYPTGGGQEYDTGTLGDARVIDVFKDAGEPVQVIHVIEGELPPGIVHARIDANRRLRHMQHHTAQHLLTHCFVHLINAETASANINGNSPSTLDLAIPEVEKSDLERAENLANAMIYENRDVKAYFVATAEVQNIPLRKKPTVSENIRIIEIAGLDYSACGGTHVSQTGSIGLLKIVKTERVNDKLRVHFIAGWQALDFFRAYFDTFTKLGAQMSAAPLELPQIVLRISEQLGSAQKEIQALRMQKIKGEAALLAQQSQAAGSRRFVQASFANRPMQELRFLADELRQQPDITSILINVDGLKLSLIVACGSSSGSSARDLLRQLLEPISGRGGGDNTLAQGGGSATQEQLAALIAQADALITP